MEATYPYAIMKHRKAQNAAHVEDILHAWFFAAWESWSSNTKKIFQHYEALDQWESSLDIPGPMRVDQADSVAEIRSGPSQAT